MAQDGLRQQPSGGWQARYVGPDGRRYARTFRLKGDATFWRASELRLIELDNWAPPARRGEARRARGLTVGAWAAAEVTARTTRTRRPIKSTTADNYRKLLRLTLDGTPLAGMQLAAVKRADIESWRWSLPVERATLNGKAYELLVSIFAAAVDAGRVEVNPCTLRGAGAPERAREPQTLTSAELDALLAAAPPRFRPALELSATCALRIGEVLALRRRDLDLQAGALTVRGTVAKLEDPSGARRRVVQAPKTAAAYRTIHVLPRSLPRLREWLTGLPDRGPDSLLFGDVFGKPLNDDVLRRAFKKAAAAIGRPELRPHDLRATGATLSAQAGATVREIQEQLGHTTPAQALRYQTATAERDQERARRVSDAWG